MAGSELRRLTRLATIAVGFIVVLAASRFVVQEITLSRTAIRSADAVDILERVELGGLEQSLLIRGRQREAPVLLWLHGGPGRPFFPIARAHPPKLEELYLVVYWAQRGTPGSNGRRFEFSSLTMEQLIADTRDLIDYLRRRFGRDRIFLLGDSWGSALGAMVASRHPEGLYAYIGMANSICRCESDTYNVRFALDRAEAENNRLAISELEPIVRKAQLSGAASVETSDLVTIAQWIRHYGGYSRSQPYDHSSRWSRLVPHGALEILTSPDYSVDDLFRFIRSPLRPFRMLFDELSQIDIRRDASRIDVPVFLLHGRHDGSTPLFLVQDYFQRLEAPAAKRLVIFEESGHEIILDEPEKFLRTLGQVANIALRAGTSSLPPNRAQQQTSHSAFQSGSGSLLASTLGASAPVGGLCHAAAPIPLGGR